MAGCLSGMILLLQVTVKHAKYWTLNDRANFVSRIEQHGYQLGNY